MRLQSKRLILEPPKLSDAPYLVRWLKDAAVHKFTTRRPVKLKDELRWRKTLKKRKDLKNFRIVTKEGVLLGTTSLFLNLFDHTADYHILIANKSYWNKGCGTEVTKLMLEYGFQKLRLHKIVLDVYSYNSRALKVYKKFGFRVEGRFRKEIRWKNKYYDNIRMGLLKSEWMKLNKKDHE